MIARKLAAGVLALITLITTGAPGSAPLAKTKKGLVRENGYIHYYRRGKLVKSEAVTVNDVTYYFSPKGRGFVSLRNRRGNRAVSRLIDQVTFKAGMTKRAKLRKLYCKVRRYQYVPYDESAPKKKAGWYTLANKTTIRKNCKCYGYAAVSAVIAKAMGYKNVRIRLGKSRRPGKGVSTHAWVTVGKRVLDGSFDNSYMFYTGSSSLKFFMKTYTDIRTKNPKAYRIRYTKINKTWKIS